MSQFPQQVCPQPAYSQQAHLTNLTTIPNQCSELPNMAVHQYLNSHRSISSAQDVSSER
jgi:hypothetical protein